jgi:hypothetical protein
MINPNSIKFSIFALGLLMISGICSREIHEDIDFHRLSSRKDTNMVVTRDDFIYVLGTQSTKVALPYIISYLDTFSFDTSTWEHAVYFLRYIEGLPLTYLRGKYSLDNPAPYEKYYLVLCRFTNPKNGNFYLKVYDQGKIVKDTMISSEKLKIQTLNKIYRENIKDK